MMRKIFALTALVCLCASMFFQAPAFASGAIYGSSDWTKEIGWIADDGCVYGSSDWTKEIGWIADDGSIYGSSDWTREIGWISDGPTKKDKGGGAFILFFND